MAGTSPGPARRNTTTRPSASWHSRLAVTSALYGHPAAHKQGPKSLIAVLLRISCPPGRAADRPGVDGQPAAGAVQVAIEHDRQRVLAVMTPLGGGQGGALPCCAGLPRGGPGGDDVEQRVCFCGGHAGLE